MYGKRLTALALTTAITLTAGFALAFFYAPMDADQGFMQKIFYVHVPLGIVALCGFVWGGIMAVQHLRTDDRSYDLKSYVAIHLSLVLGVAVLVTGSIWAKASWGSWWVWDEPTLVSFLIVFLLYACYQPLRFSIEDPEKQARYASRLRGRRRRLRAAELPRRAAGQRGRAPARLRDRRRRPAPAHEGRLLRLLPRHRAALRHALALRDGVEERGLPPPRPQAQARRRRGRAPRAGAPRRRASRHDRRAARQRRLRRRRLPRLLRAAADLRRDHGHAPEPPRARPGRARRARRRGPRARATSPCASGSRHDRAPGLRHLAQDGPGRPARAPGAGRPRAPGAAGRPRRRRRRRRGGRDLDLQPHRGLPRRRRPGRRGDRPARAPRAPRGDPPDRAGRHHVLAPQLRRGPPALPGHGRAWSR